MRYKMLVRPINLSLWYCVRANVVLQGICPSSNSSYTKSKSTMLRSLKGEVGYELAASNSDLASSGFLLSNWLNSLMVLSSRPFFHPSMADNVIVFRCSSVIYPRLLLSPCHFQNPLERVNGIPLWGFCKSDFQRALKIIIIAELFIAIIFGFQNSPGSIPSDNLGGLKIFPALQLGDFFSHLPVTYDYPADKIFGYIPACSRIQIENDIPEKKTAHLK